MLVLFSNADTQPEIFQARGGFVQLRHVDKHFVKNKRKRSRKILCFVSKMLLKLKPKGEHNPGIFFKIRASFPILKKRQGKYALFSPHPVNTARTLNVNKTFRRPPGRLWNVRIFSCATVMFG